MKAKISYDYIDVKNDEKVEELKKIKVIISKGIKYCLKEEQIETIKPIECYIKFTTNEEIKTINNQYRNIDKETDVLSFPMYESGEIKEEMLDNNLIPINLGDIIVSVEKATSQSKEYGHSFEREVIYLIIHGMFHLLGYDHIEELEKKEMRKKEEKIMEILKVAR